MTLASVLALALLLDPSPPANLPRLEAPTLDGTSIILPEAAHGSAALLIFGFTRDSQGNTSAWGRRAPKDCMASNHCQIYPVAVLQDVPRLIRGFVVSSIRKGVPPERRRYFLTLFSGESVWKRFVDYKEPDDAYLVLIDADGHVRWRFNGACDDANYEKLRQRLREMNGMPAVGLAAQGPGDFVEVKTFVPNVVLDLRYATENNFTHHRVYGRAVCVTRRSTAEKLAAVQNDLKAEDLGLKIFDCYRPLSVQRKFWALVPDERYVANPAKGSRHNRGAALDLTLVRLSDHKELDMGTEFDNFTEKAHRDYTNLLAGVLANRKKLEDAMVRRGFTGMPTEWWHFDDVDWQKYPIEDVPIGAN